MQPLEEMQPLEQKQEQEDEPGYIEEYRETPSAERPAAESGLQGRHLHGWQRRAQGAEVLFGQ